MKTIIALGDLHVPHHSPEAWRVALRVVEDLEPDVVALMGDMIDFYQVSRFQKLPSRQFQLQDDIDIAYDLMGQVRAAAPRARIFFTEGNHEDRLQRYLLTRAPELYCLRSMTVPQLLRLSDFNISYENKVNIDGVMFTHGHIVRKYSGYTAKAMAEEYGTVIFGHTHRLGIYYKRDGRGEVTAVENGCLCELSPEYITGVANWQQGFTVITTDRDQPAQFEQAKITDGKTMFRGRSWR